MKFEGRHQCLVYDGAPSVQLPTIAAMVLQKLNEGYRCLYLNSPAMVMGLRSCLAAMGMDVASEVARSRLILSSESIAAGENGFDIESMLNQLELALNQSLKDGHQGLWATGDMTWEFGSEMNFAKLMEYEYRLEELMQNRPELCGICQYHTDTMPIEVPRQALLTHRSIFVNETLSRINPHYAPIGQVSDPAATNSALDKAVLELCQVQKKKS